MVSAFVSACLLDGDDVADVFYYADCCAVAAGIGADAARFLVRKIAADMAGLYVFFEVDERLRQSVDGACVALQEVEYETERGLAPDAGKFGEIIYCCRQKF